MNRRSLLILAAAVAAPFRCEAQSQSLPIVGFVNGGAPRTQAHAFEAFRKGLAESGFIEGQSVVIEQRWAEGDYARLPALLADVIGRGASVIKVGSPQAARAAKEATSVVPIVFTSGEDPVAAGFVASLARPGGNMTGFSLLYGDLTAKRLELARELLPFSGVTALLISRTSEGAMQAKQSQDVARTMGMRLLVIEAETALEIAAAFASAANEKAGVMLIASDIFLSTQRAMIAALQIERAIPAISFARDDAKSGMLIAYGTDAADAYRKAGSYVARILRGERPADLAVQQATKVDLVINAKTAKALGLTIPPSILVRADEVLE